MKHQTTSAEEQTATFSQERSAGRQVEITVTPDIVSAAIYVHDTRNGWSQAHCDTLPASEVETRHVNQYVQFKTDGYSEGADEGHGHLYVLAITPAGEIESLRSNPRLPDQMKPDTGITETTENHLPHDSSRSHWTNRITVHRNDIEDTIKAGGRVLVIETYWDATHRPGSEGSTTFDIRNVTELDPDK